MKAAFLVVFDIPAAAPEATPAQRERMRLILNAVVRNSTEAITEVHVTAHTLTPAELAELP